MDSVLQVQKGFEDLANQTFRYERPALFQLGLRTSCVVATILCIPDAFALIPNTPSVIAWVVSLIGLWITAVVLWFVSFVGFLHFARFAAGGIQVGPKGVRLWRLGRLLTWQSIAAIEIEDQLLFTRLFSFEKTVKRLTLFTQFKSKSKIIRSMLVPHYVPSFFFTEETFDDLCRTICIFRFTLDAGSAPALIVPISEIEPLRNASSLLQWQRIALSLLIAVGMGTFVVRKAGVLYSYNDGLKLYRLNDFSHAEERFRMATFIEPSFAPAWHGLAGSQFNIGKFEDARDNWKTALKWKPDFVEAKVSLAYLSLQQRHFADAEKLINSSLLLSPNDTTTLLNRADLNLRTGHIKDAIQDAHLVTAQMESPSDRDNFMVTCLLAQAKLLQGRPNEAAKLLAPLPVTPEKLRGGENLNYRLLVGAQTCLALGQIAKADKLARMTLSRGQTMDALLLMAQVRLANKDYQIAQKILERCQLAMPQNPWTYIIACELNMQRGRFKKASANLRAAESCLPPDPLSLSRIAHLYNQLGEKDRALKVASESLSLEPVNHVAQKIVDELKKD